MTGLRIRQLHYFYALGRYLNFQAAASALNIAQSVLSRQIADLEGELGTALVDRGAKSVRLTAAGDELMRRLPEIFKQMEQMVALVQGSENGESGSVLRIGFEKILSPPNVSQTVRRLQRVCPQAHYSVSQYNYERLLHALEEREIDVAFLLMPSAAEGEGLEFTTVAEDSLALVMQQNALVSEDGGGLSALNRLPMLCLEKSAGGTGTLLKLCYEMGLVPSVRYCEQMEELLSNVRSGVGYTVLPMQYALYAQQGGGRPLRVLDLNGVRHSNLCVTVATRKGDVPPLAQRLISGMSRVQKRCFLCCHTECRAAER
jgi:DNA-binding transcriptional LysR family regulator